jgi:formyltetrahydrofolate hydrolase
MTNHECRLNDEAQMTKVFESKSPLKLAVLISGGGTTLRNLLEKIAAGRLDAQVVLVVSRPRRSAQRSSNSCAARAPTWWFWAGS